jgi:hypothetical protein
MIDDLSSRLLVVSPFQLVLAVLFDLVARQSDFVDS